MKKIPLAISVLILALIACNIASGTPTSAPQPLTASPTFEPVILTEIPPTQDIPTPAFTPLVSEPNSIRFPPGGTWLDLKDSLNAGASKIYTLSAMQGQIMSVSVLAGGDPAAWGYFPLEIAGSDGTLLCPLEVNTECEFWRGKLPLTQEYFIKVKQGGDLTDLTLRVAINPPGKAEQVFQYKNPVTGLSLAYSDQFAPVLFPGAAGNKIESELALQFIDTNSYFNTNLSEAYFLYGSSSDPQVVATCADPNPNGGAPEEAKGIEAVNGLNFVHSQSVGAGAGNIYEQETYSAAHQGVCHEAIFFIHYSNVGNYAPGTVIEFDHDGLLQKFHAILSSFQVK